MALTQTQIDELIAIDASGKIEVCEYIQVDWDAHDANETRYYASSAYHEMTPFANIGVVIEPRIMGFPFREFELNPDLRTRTITLKFDDIDHTIRNKFSTFGSGIRAEVFLYYPQVQGSLSVWFGQLQAPQIYGWKTLDVVATNGFRSRELKIPKRNRPTECTSNFGGLLPDAESVRSNLCPYDRHLGGSVGLYKTGTTPFSDCPRDTTACSARFGHTRFFGGFIVDASAVVTDQRSGYLAVSRGNASKLKDPIRVIAGTKYVRAMQLLRWRREENQNTPEHGWVATEWEVGEGPVQSIRNIKVQEKFIEAMHINTRLGERGQARTAYAPDASNFSSTAFFFARYGWVDPTTITASDLQAEAVVDGFREVVIFNPSGPGSGLLGEYFSDATWTTLVGERVDNNINFELQYGAPFDGLPATGFSIEWNGTITFPYSETYTITAEIDDGIIVTINGSEIINQTAPGTYTGNFAATAATPYTIKVEFVQGTAPGLHPWKCVLKWNSTSTTPIEVIPPSAFAHTGSSGFTRQWSDDRVWWVLNLYSNQKFGAAYPLSIFNSEVWRSVADWGRQNVIFTHTFADGETRQYAHRRTVFNAILEGRPMNEQIVDICRSGSISIPFQHQGLFEIAAFRAFSQTELDNAPIFTDQGSTANIIWQDGQPAIQLSQTPNDKVINEITMSFEDRSNADSERPIKVDDPNQKLLAGRALGDDNLQSVPKSYSAFGVTELSEALKLAYKILKFGEFDEGGIENNLRLKIIVPLVHVLNVKRYECIRVVSSLLDDFETLQANPWTHFRVLQINKKSNHTAEIIAQGYNQEVYEAFEVLNIGTTETPSPGPTEPPPFPPTYPPETPGPNPNPLPQELPQNLTIGATSYDTDKGYISVEVLS